MADRYAGRHIRQARHGAWANKKRSREKAPRQLLPAAAALTVAGILISGAGAIIQFSPAAQASTNGYDYASSYDAADYPPADRDAQANRIGRDEAAAAQADSAAAASEAPATQAPPVAATPAQPKVLSVSSSGTCKASYYSYGQGTASGEIFNPKAFTAAHKSLPFNSEVRVTNKATGKSVVVRINDRGPFVSGRCLDLSKAAFAAIADTSAGVVDVKYEVLVNDAA